MGRPQAVRVKHREQALKGHNVHVQLIGVLVEDPVRAVPQPPSGPFHGCVLIAAWQNGPCGAAASRSLRHEVPRIRLHGEIKHLAASCRLSNRVVDKVVMRLVHPGRPVRSERLTVQEKRRLAAGVKVQHDPLAPGALRQSKGSHKPAVLILATPDKSWIHWLVCHLHGFFLRDLALRKACLEMQFAKRRVKVVLQRPDPVRNPLTPF